MINVESIMLMPRENKSSAKPVPFLILLYERYFFFLTSLSTQDALSVSCSRARAKMCQERKVGTSLCVAGGARRTLF